MILETVRVYRFRNFLDSGNVPIESDVTALVGKNESGKSAFLHALFRLKPANTGYDPEFDVTEDYPRWRLADDRRVGDLSDVTPIAATFLLDQADRDQLTPIIGIAAIPVGTRCVAKRTYGNAPIIELELSFPDAILSLAGSMTKEDADRLMAVSSTEELASIAKDLATQLESDGETARATAVKGMPSRLRTFAPLMGGGEISQDARNAIWARIPGFFYFSNYAQLPGEVDLNALLAPGRTDYNEAEATALSLLKFAGVTGHEFLDSELESRMAEFEAAAIALSDQVFEFWKQNEDLVVNFVGDYKPAPDGQMHRFLNIRLADLRHGGVTTNFETRSAGFRWFFSFLAAFSSYENSKEPVVALLDEPGLSLHGEAQRDFLRFIFNRLGRAQQVIYTTHSQHMIDPTLYEKLRAVEDRATRKQPNAGVLVGPVRLSADRQTVLPVQAALGYSISQHLFIGAYRHLVVEGGSDFVYLNEFSRHLEGLGKTGLDPALSILPVGGADKIPPFVALFARHLRVTVLMDGGKKSKHVQRVNALVNEGVFSADDLVLCSNVSGTHASADIEDMFAENDYLTLVNWAFGASLTPSSLPSTGEKLTSRVEAALGREYEHGEPAAQIAKHRDDFFASIDAVTDEHFEELIRLLNATAERDAS